MTVNEQPLSTSGDLITVERELGFAYEMDGSTGAEHYQQVCPRCRRALFGLAQGAMWRDPAADNEPRPADTTMATLPVSDVKIIEGFGPHLSGMTGVRLSTTAEPERLVKTHCCFCGQQCGIQLKVRDNIVIGFEPWEEFPFNRGMLCPKGVKRSVSPRPCGAIRPPRTGSAR